MEIDSRGGLGYIVNWWYIIAPPDGTILLRRLQLILSKNKGNTEEYPAVMEYLSEHKRQLVLRQDQGDNWWELRACSFYHIFEQPKIIYSQIMNRSEFAYVDAGVYTNQKCFSIPSSDKYLLGILNSTPVWLLLTTKSPGLRGGYIEPRKELVLSIPIPKASPKEKKAIEKLVKKCLDAEGQDCEKWETEIDEIVAKLYGL